MDLIDLQWRDERSAYANVVASPYPNPEQAAKRLSAAQTALLNRLNDVQAELRAFIAVLTEIDENPRKARRDYSR